MGERTLVLVPRIDVARVPAIWYTIYVILDRTVSEVVSSASDPSRTTIRASSVSLASYMGSFILGLVSEAWLLEEKRPWDNFLGGRISSSHRIEG